MRSFVVSIVHLLLLRAGSANQSETKSDISYCVTAKSHIIHIGTHEHHPISSSLTHIPHGNDRTLQTIYCYAWYSVGLLVIT